MPNVAMDEPASSSSGPPPPRLRHSYKRPAEGTRVHQEGTEKQSGDNLKRSRGIPKEIADEDLFWAVWWTDVDFSSVGEENQQVWINPETAVEVAIDVPTTRRGEQQFEHDIQGYFVGALKRRAVEVSEKRMDPETKQLLDAAKQIEVKNFTGAQAFEAIPDHMNPPKEIAVNALDSGLDSQR
jgi:hypothetical protein